jgi:hypothetical protein
MAYKECDNCGQPFITEADPFVYQNRPQGEYYSCGCVEFCGFRKIDIWCKKGNRKPFKKEQIDGYEKPLD